METKSKRIFTIIDVETSGKGIRNNRITEICIVRMEDGEIADKFVSLVNPEQHIPNYITELTGIDDEMVSSAPIFAEIAEEVIRLTKDAVFVAHNVSFDFHVVRSEFKYLGYNYERLKLCTVKLSRKLIPNLFSYSLGKLCDSLSIPLLDRHRAEGDTDATVILFQRLLSLDEDFKAIDAALKPKEIVSRLPTHINNSHLDILPRAAGVYKFQDIEGNIIYVGKAKNIKKRVLSHFQSRVSKELFLCGETHSIDFEITGSELLALLLEADLIQKLLPKYNTVQKKKRTAFHIKSYFTKAGVLQMAVEECPAVHEPTELFFTKGAAKKKLEKLCENFTLCPKFCGLQRKKGRCSHIKFTDCLGVCCDEEKVNEYNQRANQALSTLKAETESYLIKEKGRHHGEQAFVLVLDGIYQGFGFVDGSQQVASIDEMVDLIRPRMHNFHVVQLLKAYGKKNPYRITVLNNAIT